MPEISLMTKGKHLPPNNVSRITPRISEQKQPLRLSIIIPCYNEATTISLVLTKVINASLPGNMEKEIILINDCSTDNTDSIINDFIAGRPEVPITCLHHTVNKGKGAAIQTGIAKAIGEFLVIQDADLEYDPSDYSILLAPMLKGQADVVFGSRFVGGNPHRILFFWHTIGNRLLTLISNLLSNLNLTDMETGYKLFRTYLIQQVQLKENRFGFEPEITIKLSRIPRIRIYEVGISYYGRTYEEGKKIGLKDALRCVYCLLKYRFFSNNARQIIVRHEIPVLRSESV
jgi:glycosyltransferase involved in cell wall biosynthesis